MPMQKPIAGGRVEARVRRRRQPRERAVDLGRGTPAGSGLSRSGIGKLKMAAALENGVVEATRGSPRIGRSSRSSQPGGTSVSVFRIATWPPSPASRVDRGDEAAIGVAAAARARWRARGDGRAVVTLGSVLPSSASRMRCFGSVCSNRVANSRSRWARPLWTGHDDVDAARPAARARGATARAARARRPALRLGAGPDAQPDAPSISRRRARSRSPRASSLSDRRSSRGSRQAARAPAALAAPSPPAPTAHAAESASRRRRPG